MKDLMIAAGKYKNADGEEKTRYVKLGVMMEGTAEKSPYLLLDPGVNLAAYMQPGKDRVLVSVFDQRKKKDPLDQRPDEDF
ncbi:hypothetical protein CSIRO_3078 [Bradyrhizobiaceae bacterium SG-6C]|nr:hypothetical protein CSIRO_3078 [Bradyrhizobiaceae bacterium SG-6C]